MYSTWKETIFNIVRCLSLESIHTNIPDKIRTALQKLGILGYYGWRWSRVLAFGAVGPGSINSRDLYFLLYCVHYIQMLDFLHLPSQSLSFFPTWVQKFHTSEGIVFVSVSIIVSILYQVTLSLVMIWSTDFLARCIAYCKKALILGVD